ncbi:MAG: sensor histidine kinase [Desulfurivibrionaceae bacterium]
MKNEIDRDLDEILGHIAQKKSYSQYDSFTPVQNKLLRVFFDLCQECRSLQELYKVSVGVLKCFFEVRARLYLYDDQGQEIRLVCDSDKEVLNSSVPPPEYVEISSTPYTESGSFLTPVYNKQAISSEVHGQERMILGMLEIDGSRYKLADGEYDFLEIFASRVGCNIHSFSITFQSKKHIAFIKNLVRDIEHNVIIPNMYFRHLFIRLHKKIREMEGLKKDLEGMKEQMEPEWDEGCQDMLARMSSLYDDLLELQNDIQEHHRHTSLFLESLCRRDHFEQGHLVLRLKECSVDREVIAPQLARYQSRLQARGIEVEKPVDMVDEEIPLRVDIGLLSQVYANLFSNAATYTRQVRGADGKSRKALAYGREITPDYFGPGKDGIKFNVFTTGPHIPPEERDFLFNEGYQGKGGNNRTGSGHGLNFIKQVVEMHGGVVGYEPTLEGNNFYFILPLPDGSSS